MSKIKISGKVLVVQLGRQETQIVLVGSDSSILHGTTVPTPAGAVEDGVIRNPEAVRDMLRTALKTPAFKRVRQVVFSLCTSQVIAETVTTPELPAARLEKLLRANMDMYFPVDTQDYHLVWQIIGPRAGGAKELAVQLWAVPIALLKRYYTVANECGLSVVAIDYCGHSAVTAAGASFSRISKAHKKSQPVAAAAGQLPTTDLHVLLERDLLGMTFVQNGQVVLQRFIRCGADPTYQFGELAMMLEYFRSLDIGRGSPIRGVASGLLAVDDQIVADLADVMGIPFTKLAVSYWIPWGLCVGASHTDLEFGIQTLNAPGKVRTEIGGQLWQYALILVGGLAILGVVMLTLSARIVWNAEIANLQNQQQVLLGQAAEYSGFADNYYEYQSMYGNYEADWTTTFDSLQTYNDNLVLVLEELEDLMPEQSSVIDMYILENQMFVEFACENKEEVAYLIMALREMQYTDLLLISDLWGGGNGPATSYGSDASGEAPPTEGSKASISEVIANAMEDGVLNEISISQIKALEKAYSKQPYRAHDTVDALKAEESYSADDRKPAIEQMLTTNPFAAVRFRDMLVEDFKRDENAILINDVSILIEVMNTGWLTNQPTNVKDAQKCMGDLLKIFTKTETRLNNLEKLLCSDENMALTYIHYLGVQMGEYPPENFPYLDLNKMVQDVETNGQFMTEDAALNEVLNSLIPEIDTEATEPDPTFPDPTEPGATEPGVTEPGPTEPDIDIDDAFDQITEDMIAKYLQLYLTSGQTGFENIDDQIEQYLKEGETDSPRFDAAMNSVINSDKVEDALLAVVYIHYHFGETGYDVIDDVLDKYYEDTENHTGIPVLDKKITEALQKILDSIKVPKPDNGGNTGSNTGSSTKPSGSSGSSGGGSAGPIDTRIHFIAALVYNDELKNAELDRKGLSSDDMIGPLEVGE